MKFLRIIILLSGFSLTGCGFIQTAIEDKVEAAVKDKVNKKVDEILATKGLSAAQIKASIDANQDNKISKDEVIGSLKDYSKDFLVLEMHKYLSHKTNSNIDSKTHEIWQQFIGLVGTIVSAYLLKQIRSAKTNSQTQARLEIMEKLLGYDPDEANHQVTPAVPAARLAVAIRRKKSIKKGERV